MQDLGGYMPPKVRQNASMNLAQVKKIKNNCENTWKILTKGSEANAHTNSIIHTILH